jgi:SIR2-like domain
VYWNELISFIKDKKCIPFVGSGAHSFLKQNGEPWIPPDWKIAEYMIEDNMELFRDFELAREWIKEIKQNPLIDDTYQLAKVSQFLAIESRDERYPKLKISEYLRARNVPDFSSEQYKNTSYAVLADLDLPIYVTTNYDLFLEKALVSRSKGEKNPVSGYSRWNHNLALSKQLEYDRKYLPTPSKPFVYHLHGYITKPESMVLTERDYFEFVSYFNKERETDIYPSFMIRQLPLSSLVFIGYSLQNITFRSIFQGALSFLGGKPQTTSLSVQLPSTADNDKNSFSEKVMNYFNEYNKNMFDIQVYWGNVSDFSKDLRDGVTEFESLMKLKSAK